MQIIVEMSSLCISKISFVKSIEQVHQSQDWQKAKIEPPTQRSLSVVINNIGGLETCV